MSKTWKWGKSCPPHKAFWLKTSVVEPFSLKTHNGCWLTLGGRRPARLLMWIGILWQPKEEWGWLYTFTVFLYLSWQRECLQTEEVRKRGTLWKGNFEKIGTFRKGELLQERNCNKRGTFTKGGNTQKGATLRERELLEKRNFYNRWNTQKGGTLRERELWQKRNFYNRGEHSERGNFERTGTLTKEELF